MKLLNYSTRHQNEHFRTILLITNDIVRNRNTVLKISGIWKSTKYWYTNCALDDNIVIFPWGYDYGKHDSITPVDRMSMVKLNPLVYDKNTPTFFIVNFTLFLVDALWSAPYRLYFWFVVSEAACMWRFLILSIEIYVIHNMSIWSFHFNEVIQSIYWFKMKLLFFHKVIECIQT